MKFKQFKDGSCDIKFSWKERITLLITGKLHLSDVGLRHFGNFLVKMVADWNVHFTGVIHAYINVSFVFEVSVFK